MLAYGVATKAGCLRSRKMVACSHSPGDVMAQLCLVGESFEC